MSMERVARRDTPLSGSPDTDDFRKNFEWLYLERQKICLADNSNIESEEHAHGRGGTTGWPSSGSADTDDFRKNFVWVYLEKRQICPADYSNIVSEEHVHVRGGTTGPPVERFSRYRRDSKKNCVRISGETANLPDWKDEHCMRRTCTWKRQHDGTPRLAVLLIPVSKKNWLCISGEAADLSGW